MIVDANVLLYAIDEDARGHRPARAWLVSADTDFARFPDLEWINPLSL